MNLFQFMSDSPFVTIVLAWFIGQTVIHIVDRIADRRKS